MKALFPLIVLASVAICSTGHALSVEFSDSDGDDKMWLCQYSRSGEDIRGTVSVSHSGYFRLSTIDNTMFDSGDHQRNESYYLLIKNSLNPSGQPIDPNCAGVYVLLDQVALPAHLGTFLLAEGEVNTIELYHACDLYRQDLCTQWFDPEGESGGGCKNCESVSLVLSTIDLERELNICQPGYQAVMDEDPCDGLDNDCDGQVDEDCAYVCQPSAELCDGLDNDCNGLVDDGGVCDSSACVPSLELCDGLDNDCNGQVDDGAYCESGSICAFGSCRQECRGLCDASNESCDDGVCLPEPCGDRFCAPGVVCANEQCVDLCDQMNCAAGSKCVNGACIDASCHSSGCPTGLLCIQGQCVSDPCRDVACNNPSEFCRDGVCVGSCAVTTCDAGTLCVDGDCVEDLCDSVQCASAELCIDGDCVADLCVDVLCPGRLSCVAGVCQGDPCDSIQCPASQLCHAGQCYSPAQLEQMGLAVEREVDGACACQLGRAGTSPSWLALLLPLAALLLRRRTHA